MSTKLDITQIQACTLGLFALAEVTDVEQDANGMLVVQDARHVVLQWDFTFRSWIALEDSGNHTRSSEVGKR